MNSEKSTTFIMIPETDMLAIRQALQDILTAITSLAASSPSASIIPDYIPASAFMKAVNIKRTKLHELIVSNKIQTLKKRRKLYVLATEVSRYFTDPSIQ